MISVCEGLFGIFWFVFQGVHLLWGNGHNKNKLYVYMLLFNDIQEMFRVRMTELMGVLMRRAE